MLCGVLFKYLMSWGTLRIIDARGKRHEFSGTPGPEVTIRLHDKALHYKLFWNPRLAVGEGYMDGTLTMENGGRIIDLIDLVGANLNMMEANQVIKFRNWLTPLVRPLQQHNPISRSRKNVAHHYNLSDGLFDLFLDSDRQYSCAYFDTPNDSLEQAQLAKKHHLAAKLVLDRPGLKMLDIGSGWGGLGIYIHQKTGADVTGLTLSTEQQAYAAERAKELGLSDQVRFNLRDYRLEEGTYDRIVSVGMFEHVGVSYYVEFFNKLKALLTEDGIAVVHTIARWDGPSVTNPWLRKYIFPGGYTPSMSEIFAALEGRVAEGAAGRSPDGGPVAMVDADLASGGEDLGPVVGRLQGPERDEVDCADSAVGPGPILYQTQLDQHVDLRPRQAGYRVPRFGPVR